MHSLMQRKTFEAQAAATRLVSSIEAGNESDIYSDLAQYEACLNILATVDTEHAQVLSSLLLSCTQWKERMAFVSAEASHACDGDAAKNKMAITTDSLTDLFENSSISSSIVRPETINLCWENVFCSQEVKDALFDAVVMPARYPSFFEDGMSGRGALIYGPPGTGKTMLATALAKEIGAIFFSISAADLLSKWMGESEKKVKELFSLAMECPLALVFLDEVDALCSSRGENGESECSRRVKTEFLIRMQEIDSRRVFVMAATNIPWNLDSAFVRRFDQRVYVGLPSYEARHGMLLHLLQGLNHSLGTTDVQQLAQNLEGMTGSDVATVVRHAYFHAVHDVRNATHFRLVNVDGAEAFAPCDATCIDAQAINFSQLHPNKLTKPLLTVHHFDAAITKYETPITEESLARFQSWNRKLSN